ncbi:MAG: hypothetical protein J7L35_02640 [Anaerolineales bacterium]|nr:hypothetical protein [Anaerolineales bacterium]
MQKKFLTIVSILIESAAQSGLRFFHFELDTVSSEETASCLWNWIISDEPIPSQWL